SSYPPDSGILHYFFLSFLNNYSLDLYDKGEKALMMWLDQRAVGLRGHQQCERLQQTIVIV
ncbi:MAG: hypothetical protein R6U98_18705, partial [Pirellulaceae bacterium]